MFCCTLLYVHSSFAIILMGKRAGCFAQIVFLVSRDFYVALHRDAMGLSAVCDNYSFKFINLKMQSCVRCTFVCVSVYLCLVVTCLERANLLALVCGLSLHPYLLLITIQYWF